MSFFVLINFLFIIAYRYISIYEINYKFFSLDYFKIYFVIFLIFNFVYIFRNFTLDPFIFSKEKILLFSILILIFYLFLQLILNFNPESLVSSLINVLFFLLSIVTGLSIRKSNFMDLFLYLLGGISIILISFTYYNYSRDFTFYRNGLLSLSVNSVYYVSFLLIFITLKKFNSFSLFIILTSLLIILFSDKANPLLGFILFFGFIIFFRIKIAFFMKIFIFLLIFSFLIMFQFIFINSEVVILILNFFTRDDARLFLIVNFFIELTNFSVFSILLGNGYNSSILFLGSTLHNDFLELFFNFGITGFLLYSFLFSKLLISKSLLNKVIYSVFFIMSFFTHFIFIPTYSAIFAFYLGYNHNEK